MRLPMVSCHHLLALVAAMRGDASHRLRFATAPRIGDRTGRANCACGALLWRLCGQSSEIAPVARSVARQGVALAVILGLFCMFGTAPI